MIDVENQTTKQNRVPFGYLGLLLGVATASDLLIESKHDVKLSESSFSQNSSEYVQEKDNLGNAFAFGLSAGLITASIVRKLENS